MSPKLSFIEKRDSKKDIKSKNLLKNCSSFNLLPEESQDNLEKNLSIEEINRLDSQYLILEDNIKEEDVKLD